MLMVNPSECLSFLGMIIDGRGSRPPRIWLMPRLCVSLIVKLIVKLHAYDDKATPLSPGKLVAPLSI